VPDLLLLPGLGADGRLFQEQAFSLPGRVVIPPWPPLRSGESLGRFARRLAETLPAETPKVVGGASFGGMVAWELAAIVRPKVLVLVGSCRRPESISPSLRVLGRLCSRLPESLFKARPWTSPLLLPKFGHLDPAQRRLFWDMASKAEPAFVRWGCRAILSWQPSDHDVPCFQLHGSADRIIPVQRVRPTQIVAGAGHLLTLSHSAETTAFLSRVLAEVA
jgi:pimeloyl-ACP methyl ester carboxylesterase